MGHADLRIKERTLPVVAERAHELLRDRPRLSSWLVAQLNALHQPEAERVALDLENTSTPARLLVTREGRAVTCLGAGMTTDAPVVAWNTVGTYLDRQRQALRVKLASARLEDEDNTETLNRMWQRSYRFTRAEFDQLQPLAPLLALDSVSLAQDILGHLQRLDDPRITRSTLPLAREYLEATWRLYRAMGLHLMLCQHERATVFACMALLAADDTYLAQVAWWVLLNHPRRTLDVLRTELAHARSALTRVVGRIIAMSISARYRWLEREAAEAMRALESPGMPSIPWDPVTDRRNTMQQVRYTWANIAALAWDAFGNGRIQDVTPVISRAGEAIIQGATDVPGVLAAAGADEDLQRAARMMFASLDHECEPRTVPRAWDALSQVEQATSVAWRAAIHVNALPLGVREPGMGLGFSVAPVEAMVPHPEPVAHFRLSQGVEFIRHQLVPARKLARDGMQRAKPATRAATPGPNAPCSCGSGRKYKKCCGAAA